MIIARFNSTEATEASFAALLTLFRDATIESDYMAKGEINDIETLKKVLLNKNLLHFFGYEANVPIAYCQVLYKADSVNFNSGAKINALSLLPQQRGKGLGKELLEHAITVLQENPNLKNIYLEVVKNNTRAINLYKELGFEKVGELKSLFTKDHTLMDIEIYSLLVN